MIQIWRYNGKKLFKNKPLIEWLNIIYKNNYLKCIKSRAFVTLKS